MKARLALFALGLLLAGCGEGNSLDGELYGEWTGPEDAETKVFVYRGFEHCGTEKVAELQAHDTAADSRTYYLWDPSGSMAHYISHAPAEHSGEVDALPDGARESGFERAGRTLWFADDGAAAYFVDGERIERWPRWEWSLTNCD